MVFLLFRYLCFDILILVIMLIGGWKFEVGCVDALPVCEVGHGGEVLLTSVALALAHKIH